MPAQGEFSPLAGQGLLIGLQDELLEEAYSLSTRKVHACGQFGDVGGRNEFDFMLRFDGVLRIAIVPFNDVVAAIFCLAYDGCFVVRVVCGIVSMNFVALEEPRHICCFSQGNTGVPVVSYGALRSLSRNDLSLFCS